MDGFDAEELSWVVEKVHPHSVDSVETCVNHAAESCKCGLGGITRKWVHQFALTCADP